jgi:hypothetical protein
VTARVLSFTNEVREAAKDARSLRMKLKDEGHEWAPALAKANAKMVELALKPSEDNLGVVR